LSASTPRRSHRDAVVNVKKKRTMSSVPFADGETFGCVRCDFEAKAKTFEGRMEELHSHFDEFPDHRWPKDRRLA